MTVTKVQLENRIKQDMVTLDKCLFEQLVGMLEGLSEMRYRTELNERHIKLINTDLAEIRGRLGI